ncbi:CBS domain-containing protein [Rhizobium sp. BK376]|uniref:CBS domain-containing protein n=1 Tax=Rhizobium sp. BK376 TaxID=2512149 RepID=UPI0010485890|nr:CBS domain-containing protein [Rhizobium sp. BK376]
MLIRSLMTSPVTTVTTSTLLADAAKLMLEKQIGGLPVVNDRRELVGIITESDFLRRGELGTEKRRSRWLSFFLSAGKMADEYVRSHGRKVEEVMSWPVETISPETDTATAAAIMEKRAIKRLPVVFDGKVVGIVSRSDFMRALAKTASADASAQSDARIEAAIIEEISAQPWSGNGSVRVSVNKGVAELSGTIFDDRERAAARVAAENIAGVKEVIDHLVWVEPNSGMVMMPPGSEP